MRDVVTIIVLLAFSFISHMLHHILTLFRSRFIDSETVTLSPGDGTKDSVTENSLQDFKGSRNYALNNLR